MSTLWQRNDTTQIFPVLQLQPEFEPQSLPGHEPGLAGDFQIKESKLMLSVQTRYHGDIVILQCQGRIVYRNEAATFSHLVREALKESAKVLLDMSGVTLIDCAGIGELATLHARAKLKHAELKYAELKPFVLRHIELTHLTTFLEIHPRLDEALTAFEAQCVEVCAGC